jgi:hypothetical protein
MTSKTARWRRPAEASKGEGSCAGAAQHQAAGAEKREVQRERCWARRSASESRGGEGGPTAVGRRRRHAVPPPRAIAGGGYPCRAGAGNGREGAGRGGQGAQGNNAGRESREGAAAREAMRWRWFSWPTEGARRVWKGQVLPRWPSIVNPRDRISWATWTHGWTFWYTAI